MVDEKMVSSGVREVMNRILTSRNQEEKWNSRKVAHAIVKET